MDSASQNISILEIFKIGIGPSSSHTMGPWKAASSFANALASAKSPDTVNHIQVDLFGSLALTGKGHGTDKAIVWGLTGAIRERSRWKHCHGFWRKWRKATKSHWLAGIGLPFIQSSPLYFIPMSHWNFILMGCDFRLSTAIKIVC